MHSILTPAKKEKGDCYLAHPIIRRNCLRVWHSTAFICISPLSTLLLSNLDDPEALRVNSFYAIR